MATKTGPSFSVALLSHYRTKKKCQEHLKKDSNNQIKRSVTHSRRNNRQKLNDVLATPMSAKFDRDLQFTKICPDFKLLNFKKLLKFSLCVLKKS